MRMAEPGTDAVRQPVVARVMGSAADLRLTVDSTRFAVCFLALGAILPVVIAGSRSRPWSTAYLVVLLVCLQAAAGLAYVLASDRMRPMSLGFWTYSYLFLGLAALAQLGEDRYPSATGYPDSIALRAAIITEVGVLAYACAYHLRRPWGRPRPADRPSLLAGGLSGRRILWLSAVSLVLTALLVQKLGLSSLFTSRQAAVTAAAASSPDSSSKASRALLSWGAQVSVYAALLGLIHCRDFVRPAPPRDYRNLPVRWWHRRSAGWFALTTVVALANLAVNNPISQSRFWSGTVILGLIFCTPYLRRPQAFRAGAAAVLVLFIVVFPYSDLFRYTKSQTVTVTSLSDQFTNKLDYDSFAQIEVGIAYVDATGLHPQAALGPPLFWVPRSHWAGKPNDTGVVLSQYVGYTITNRSAPLWIESYQVGGLAAVVVVFAAAGLGARRLDEFFNRYAGRPGVVANFVPVLGFFQLILLRGSLLQATAPFVLLLVVALLLPRSRTSR